MAKIYNEMAGEMMSPRNGYIHNLLAKLEIATLECENLGLEVETVQWFEHHKPRLVVKDNAHTRRFVKAGRAINYGSEVKNGVRLYLNQMMLNGIKVIWKSDEIKH